MSDSVTKYFENLEERKVVYTSPKQTKHETIKEVLQALESLTKALKELEKII